MAVSFQCMTKSTTNKKKKKRWNLVLPKKKKKDNSSFMGLGVTYSSGYGNVKVLWYDISIICV